MSKKRVLLGLSIIAGGVCASLPFRREATVSTAPDSEVASPQKDRSPLLPLAVSPPPVPTVAPGQTVPGIPGAPSPYMDNGSERLKHVIRNQSRSPAAIEEIPALPKDKSAALPMLPVSFQVKEADESHRAPWQPPKLAEGPAAPPREHRIRKLDTLEDLAERFLGSKDRADEIFEANRNVLKDRHILPLGAAIRIPSGGLDTPNGSSESDLQPVRAVPDR